MAKFSGNYKKVTKEEFYQEIYDKKLDVSPGSYGDKYPYTSLFKFRNGQEWGRICPISDLPTYEYFIFLED